MFVLLFNCSTANNVADSVLQKYCKKISDYPGATGNPNYYSFCVASLKENPESQKVRNIDDLTLVGTNNALKNLTNVKGMVENILKERKYKSSLSKKLLEDCLKLYSEGYQSLTTSLKYLKAREFQNARKGFYDAKTGPTLCELEFNGDNQQISPVKKENYVLEDMVDIPNMFNIITHRQ